MTDTNNGWAGKPGVPLNPEEDGWHWVKGCDGENTIVFWHGHGGDTHHENGDLKDLDHWSGYPMWIAQDWTYLGPVLTPDEAAKREDAKRQEGYAEGVLDVRRAGIERRTKHKALQARVAELEEALRDARARYIELNDKEAAEAMAEIINKALADVK